MLQYGVSPPSEWLCHKLLVVGRRGAIASALAFHSNGPGFKTRSRTVHADSLMQAVYPTLPPSDWRRMWQPTPDCIVYDLYVFDWGRLCRMELKLVFVFRRRLPALRSMA